MHILKRVADALRAALRTLSPDCRQASRLQSEALDRPLTLARRLGLRLHLLLCRWCRRYGKQIRFLRRIAHEHPEKLIEAAPQTLSPEARERLKRSLDRQRK